MDSWSHHCHSPRIGQYRPSLDDAGILPNPFTQADTPPPTQSVPEGTLSAVDIAATQLAAAEATATQAYLAEQQQAVDAQTQTQQALVQAEQQTQTAIAAYTSTPSPTKTQHRSPRHLQHFR